MFWKLLPSLEKIPTETLVENLYDTTTRFFNIERK